MNIIGRNIAGSIFPTFISFILRILIPTPIRSTPPVAVISVITTSLRYGAINEASKVMDP
jgi:hypothetical protein